MLDIQYRMHPSIAAFPSHAFYDGLLRTGISEAARPAPKGFPWPDRSMPVAFAQVDGLEEPDGSSYRNHSEAIAVLNVLRDVLTAGELRAEDIGVISPYSAQVHHIRHQLNTFRWTHQDPHALEVSSVDGFQGREKELIIVSPARANSSGKVGFLSDPRRLNVTITRARRGLIVCGNSQTLAVDERCWRPWLIWVQNQGLVTSAETTHHLTDTSVVESSCHVDVQNPRIMKSRLCPSFERGQCTWGDRCFYSHTREEVLLPRSLTSAAKVPIGSSASQRKNTPTPRSGIVCPDWQRGQCKWGSSCYNAHEVREPVAPTRRLLQPTILNQDQAGTCSSWVTTGWCKWGSECFFPHGKVKSEPGLAAEDRSEGGKRRRKDAVR